jgi:hypothetical protein
MNRLCGDNRRVPILLRTVVLILVTREVVWVTGPWEIQDLSEYRADALVAIFQCQGSCLYSLTCCLQGLGVTHNVTARTTSPDNDSLRVDSQRHCILPALVFLARFGSGIKYEQTHCSASNESLTA